MKEVNQTVQDPKMEREPINKTQTERILEMENLGKHTGNTNRNNTSRIEEMDECISDGEDTMEETGMLVKANIKSNQFLTESIQKILNIMTRPHLKIIGIEEYIQLKGIGNIFNKIIEKISNLKKTCL